MIVDLRPIFRALPHFTRRFMPYSWYSEEWWNLNDELGKWIVPHLKAMRERGTGWPGDWANMSDKEAQAQWSTMIDEMIDGFQLLAEDGPAAFGSRDKINRAFELLSEHWPSLWD